MNEPIPIPDFEEQFRAVEKRLRSNLEETRAKLRHAGNKGMSAEGAFRQALAGFLPRRLSVGHGEVIDRHGHRSAQCDVVVATDQHPNWIVGDGPSLFLVEAVAGVAEVKSVLTSTHLQTSLDNTRQFRQLKPDWSGLTEVAGNAADVARYYRSPPLFLFAYESELTLETIAERVQEAGSATPGRVGESIDGIFVLDRGYVMNFGAGDGAFVVQGPSGDRLFGYYWDDQRSPLMTLMRWLPTALAVPLSQLPVLVNYLLVDVSARRVTPE
jgi:hypothetical protein